MASHQAPSFFRIPAIGYAIVAIVGIAQFASAADLLSFRATPIKGPECVTDTTGYFYAEDELNPDPATAMPPLTHFYLVVRNVGLDAVAAPPAYDFGRLPADYEYPDFRNLP